jgi:hypothetical protein
MISMGNVGRDYRVFFHEFGFTIRFCALKRLWAIVHGLLCGLVQKMGYHGHLRAMV